MKLVKFEQSGFIFETNGGFRLALDIGNRTPIEKLEGVRADAMIISHLHPDHLSFEQIKKLSPAKLFISDECREALDGQEISSEITKIKSNSDIFIEDIQIKIFDVDHGPNVPPPKENFGFLFKIDNETIYFPGDMFYASGIDVTNLEVDYALLPIGAFYTFGPQEAFDFAKTFKKIGKIISMHDRGNPEMKKQFLELAKDNFVTE